MRYIALFLIAISSLFSAEKKTVCLNMIVKNEKDVIVRCLNSVKPIIDYWVIVDTGSTDGTQQIIKECMKDIPGELYERPWKNFGHNRNEALSFARTKADYVLIIDADDSFEYEEGFVLPELTCDAYQVKIQHGGTTFYRTQFVNMSKAWSWKGVLHEYLFCPEQTTTKIMEGITYVDTRSGARSRDPEKYKKDAAVLETALKDEPNNSRYMFYLAQSYRDAGELENAITWYQKRVAMGGWEEEVYFSLYQIAVLQERLKRPIDDVISSYYKAYRFRPHRPEAAYHLSSIFRRQGQYALSYSVLKSREFFPKPVKPDILFVESWIENYGFLTELSISSYHVGRYKESLNACNTLILLQDLPECWRKQTELNRGYALNKLSHKKAA